jgi:hypothetical protein
VSKFYSKARPDELDTRVFKEMSIEEHYKERLDRLNCMRYYYNHYVRICINYFNSACPESTVGRAIALGRQTQVRIRAGP